MRVNDAVADRLRAHGIDTVFGIPGTQTLGLNESFQAHDDIRFVMARHETAVSHQAWGYAETSDRMAATLVVPGPGDMNAMNGLKNAYNDCTPLVHFSVETEPEVRGGDGIHETPPDTYDNAVKANITVETPEGAVAAVERGIAIARTHPQGPVRIGIPRNFMPMETAHAGAEGYRAETVTDVPAGDLDEAADILAAADAPVVVAGGGVRRSGASEALGALAAALDAPVATTWKGKGVFPEDHDLAAWTLSPSHPALASLLDEADAALAVGTDFDAVTTRNWSLPMPDDLIHVSLTPDDIGFGYEPAVGVVADAGAAVEGLRDRLAGRSIGDADGAARAGAVRRATEDRIGELRDRSERMTSPDVLAVARDVIPRDAIVTADGGGFRIWMIPAFEAYRPDGYVQPGSWASMGTALPAAMGAAAANPDRDVVAAIGDGGLLMCLHELHTVVAEDLPVVTLVTNNSDYAIISEAARRNHAFDAGAYDWVDAPLDLAGIAGNVGMDATRVETPDGLREALADALDADDPALVEVLTEPNEPQAHHWLADAE